MDEVEVTPMEENETLGVVRHSFECDLGIRGGRQNANHIHSEECRASSSGYDRINSPLSSNDGDVVSVKKDHVELGRSFQMAVSVYDWALAESIVPVADPQRLNDGLCIALDSIWFLRKVLSFVISSAMLMCIVLVLGFLTYILKQPVILAGAHDLTRAALRTSFLASCVSASRSRTMSLADTVTVMAQRYNSQVGERLQECNGDEILKSEAAAKVQRFTEWALKCIGSHSRGKAAHPGSPGDISMAIIHSSAVESRLQLLAFKRFLELAGSRLTKRDYTEAFDAAYPGWATGIAASAMQGLLGLLVEGGADNVNQRFLEAARFGSTELVRILLQRFKPLQGRLTEERFHTGQMAIQHQLTQA
ncbi:hypothetical protein KC19_VG232800 [Ceratodon purpureus]|uniref:Ankyrin repeat protein n=1 Tax=Ceratodon purpureus TaxID=3225 RepID=A0A8T0HTG6_CERPU|nr:hypothetical protein KC19_VG232800 [Ceratodon purpureus]